MTHILDVNLDAKCKKCGQGGVVGKTGLCMKCISNKIKNGELDHIINKARGETFNDTTNR